MCNLILSHVMSSHLSSFLFAGDQWFVCVCVCVLVVSSYCMCVCVCICGCACLVEGSSPRHLPMYQPDDVSGMDSLLVVLVNMFLPFFT